MISVIIPVYKVEKYLDECIMSVVSQTYKDIEVIIVDDGSPDSCPQICDNWAKKDSRIRVIHQENAGLSVARNIALEAANGEYIAFVDSDDFIENNLLETINNYIKKEDGIDMVIYSFSYYADGEKRYIIAPNGLKVGDKLLSGAEAAPEIGNALPLKNIPVGTVIHNIELRPGQGALLVRSAGNFAQLTSREGAYCVIKLPSGETRKILSACKATVGSVGNSDHALESSGKAGRSRWMGRRPHNRGVVMNPVDHPMGGGEGRQSGGHPRSRTGLYAKGKKTRAPKKQSSKYIIERCNKK